MTQLTFAGWRTTPVDAGRLRGRRRGHTAAATRVVKDVEYAAAASVLLNDVPPTTLPLLLSTHRTHRTHRTYRTH